MRERARSIVLGLLALMPTLLPAALTAAEPAPRPALHEADVCVYGGTSGG